MRGTLGSRKEIKVDIALLMRPQQTTWTTSCSVFEKTILPQLLRWRPFDPMVVVAYGTILAAVAKVGSMVRANSFSPACPISSSIKIHDQNVELLRIYHGAHDWP